mmetsp:Transcript_107726/g.304751  ORF Transcript_107726/g.304751 Transcript_107726/m.304751 type:complete len:234 (+) Transcript_107726:191-892(+)|eukprot:CAMPEP_0168359348 /NCGR_PEP_ID=MMETSP0228-20121227/1596_1 /TAXON_ID=133427 /ORGANISM="Protoceratium reticulatum, Strain CCCM 535 (=CCMP 1889)" /LENGTH=233 /DNA_ID=CAMNT_0008371975 /DNA_START=187 /DNA_END=888 /DNA_ORIENTATION=-
MTVLFRVWRHKRHVPPERCLELRKVIIQLFKNQDDVHAKELALGHVEVLPFHGPSSKIVVPTQRAGSKVVEVVVRVPGRQAGMGTLLRDGLGGLTLDRPPDALPVHAGKPVGRHRRPRGGQRVPEGEAVERAVAGEVHVREFTLDCGEAVVRPSGAAADPLLRRCGAQVRPDVAVKRARALALLAGLLAQVGPSEVVEMHPQHGVVPMSPTHQPAFGGYCVRDPHPGFQQIRL